jgi:transposase
VNNYNKVYVGLDVHKKTIAVAVLPEGTETVTEQMMIDNRREVIEKMVQRLALKGPLDFVYEAGPCGYVVQRQLKEMGHACAVVAPGLIPVRSADRVKTDRRDAQKLARLYRAGELTAIRIPTSEEEAARDLVRVREDILEERLRCRHRLSKFLLRQGRSYHLTKTWGVTHRVWIQSQSFLWPALQQTFDVYRRALDEAEARLESLDQQLRDLAQSPTYRTPVSYLRCLKGIDTLSALTLAVETQEFKRFSARSFMSYTGLVCSEHSSGDRVRRGGITKTGNAHLRRVLVEAAWSYRHRNPVSKILAERRKGSPAPILHIARKAQDRLQRKYWRMLDRNKPHQVVVTAVARELAGFVWAIAQQVPAHLPA